MKTQPTYMSVGQNGGNMPVTLDPIQQKLAPHVDALILFWVAVWAATACVVLYKLYGEYREQRSG